MIIVLTTVSDTDQAEAIGTRLIESRLAACVQEVAIHSRYHWEGEIQSESEILLLIKTAADREPEVVALLEEIHPYDVPEIVVVAADRVSDPYRAWLVAGTRSPEDD